MASSVNNIAATFSTFPKTPSKSSSSPINPPKKLSTSWNLHNSIPKSRRLSLLSTYGPAGPPRRAAAAVAVRSPTAERVPAVALRYVDGSDAVRTVGLAALCKGKRVAIVGAAAAFSPACGRFVKAVENKAQKRWDLVACVASNDVFVMRAWGLHLGVGDGVVMLSDGGGEIAAAIGDGRFCAIAVNGVITGVDFDDEAATLT